MEEDEEEEEEEEEEVMRSCYAVMRLCFWGWRRGVLGFTACFFSLGSGGNLKEVSIRRPLRTETLLTMERKRGGIPRTPPRPPPPQMHPHRAAAVESQLSRRAARRDFSQRKDAFPRLNYVELLLIA